MTRAGLAMPDDGLEAYIRAAIDSPTLDPEEEQSQVRLLRGSGHTAAAHRLASAHLSMVVDIARDYLKYGQSLADLIQEGNLGLIEGIECFDPVHGYRLASFLRQSVHARIGRFVLKNWRIADGGFSKEQQRLFVRMLGFKSGTAGLRIAEVNAAAAQLRVPQRQILRLEQRLAVGDIDFYVGPGGIRNHELLREGANRSNGGIAAVEEVQWSQSRIQRLLRALTTLDGRARDIVRRRWLCDGKKVRFSDLASEYRVSGERIRQIQLRAFDTIRILMR